MITGDQALDEVGGHYRSRRFRVKSRRTASSTFFILAALSVNLALVNLLQIPVLDGGHLLLYAAEAIRGKPLSRRVIEYAFRAGMVFVVSLMLLATWNDLIP